LQDACHQAACQADIAFRPVRAPASTTGQDQPAQARASPHSSRMPWHRHSSSDLLEVRWPTSTPALFTLDGRIVTATIEAEQVVLTVEEDGDEAGAATAAGRPAAHGPDEPAG
jgi:hypothetical protein